MDIDLKIALKSYHPWESEPQSVLCAVNVRRKDKRRACTVCHNEGDDPGEVIMRLFSAVADLIMETYMTPAEDYDTAQTRLANMYMQIGHQLKDMYEQKNESSDNLADS